MITEIYDIKFNLIRLTQKLWDTIIPNENSKGLLQCIETLEKKYQVIYTDMNFSIIKVRILVADINKLSKTEWIEMKRNNFKDVNQFTTFIPNSYVISKIEITYKEANK